MRKIHREKVLRGRSKKEEGSQPHTHSRNLETFRHFFFSLAFLKIRLKNNLHKRFLHDRRASIVEPRNAKYYSQLNVIICSLNNSEYILLFVKRRN